MGTSAHVQANGGKGWKARNGGSGGRVIIDMVQVQFTKVSAEGGAPHETHDGCRAGAAGTVFLKDRDTLLVKNGNLET